MPVHPLAKNMPEEYLALAPGFHSPAVARCCKAWNRAFKAQLKGGTSPISIRLRASEAYREAMPPLTSPQNLCDFIACVAHAVTVKAMCMEHAASLMHAAGMASRAFKLLASTANTAAPHANPRKNKISGCETVDWDFTDLETTTSAEQAPADRSRFGPK
jgi:hypothetical protein